MKITWIGFIILSSSFLLTTLKMDERAQLAPFFRAQRTLKLDRFAEAKKFAVGREFDLLELWESILTGRSAPVSKWIKSQYKSLGLNHLFTPSGFHLSATLLPFMKICRTSTSQIWLLLITGIAIFTLPGLGALKRMVLVKLGQKLSNQKMGFVVALVLDILFGSFVNSPLSFCYSFLFLGIIYSGKSFLFLWFFLGQCLIAYFNGNEITPFILILSPLLNMAFALSLPFLFILAIPLWSWQVFIGLRILGTLQSLVEVSVKICTVIPSLEVHSITLLCFVLIYFGKKRLVLVTLVFISFSLNQDFKKNPVFGSYEFVPQGMLLRISEKEFGEIVYYSDGKCKRELVRGVWWEKCSPKRGRANIKKLKKLSYL
jgi:hypothetical protein